MKKILSLALMCLTISLVFTACFSDEANNSSATVSPSPMASPITSPATSPATRPMPSDSPGTSSEPESSGENLQTGSLQSYAESVKTAYAADYIPDRMFSDTEIEEKLGLSSDLYEDIYAEGSTLEENPDLFVAVRAKSGKAEEVAKKLEEYKKTLAGNTAFSANVEKITAAEVYTQGDHVFMFLLGANEPGEDITDMAEHFGNEVKKGVDTIKKMFTTN